MIRIAPEPRDIAYLYLLGADVGPLKVGITKDIPTRFDAIQKSSPLAVFLRGVWRADDWRLAASAEYEVHVALKGQHSHGEWFNVSETEALAVIERHSWKLKRVALGSIVLKKECLKPWDRRSAA